MSGLAIGALGLLILSLVVSGPDGVLTYARSLLEAGTYAPGSAPDIDPLTKIMIATWSTFARHGDPNNPLLPLWPRHDAQDGFSMMLNVSSRVERDPGGQARASLDHLPFYEYNNPANFA